MQEKHIRDFFFKTKENYRLIAGQKELSVNRLRIDVFAVNKRGDPFIIEFKKDKSNHIVGQSAQYLALIQSRHVEIETKLNHSGINWNNLKVLLIAKTFNARDHESLNYAPIKGRVFLYQYEIIKDYRQKEIVSLNLEYAAGHGSSPLYIPSKAGRKINFNAHFKKLASLEGKESRRQYYTDTLLPLLNNVAKILSDKYASKGLFPHISYFYNGPHFLLRLGTDKKQSHRASIAIHVGENYLVRGFDLTHSLSDAARLKAVIKNNKKKIITRFLKLDEYGIYIPNTGIAESISLENLNPKGLSLLLDNYDPKQIRDCYFIVNRDYESDTLTESDIVRIFDEEYQQFGFLLDAIMKH